MSLAKTAKDSKDNEVSKEDKLATSPSKPGWMKEVEERKSKPRAAPVRRLKTLPARSSELDALFEQRKQAQSTEALGTTSHDTSRSLLREDIDPQLQKMFDRRKNLTPLEGEMDAVVRERPKSFHSEQIEPELSKMFEKRKTLNPLASEGNVIATERPKSLHSEQIDPELSKMFEKRKTLTSDTVLDSSVVESDRPKSFHAEQIDLELSKIFEKRNNLTSLEVEGCDSIARSEGSKSVHRDQIDDELSKMFEKRKKLTPLENEGDVMAANKQKIVDKDQTNAELSKIFEKRRNLKPLKIDEAGSISGGNILAMDRSRIFQGDQTDSELNKMFERRKNLKLEEGISSNSNYGDEENFKPRNVHLINSQESELDKILEKRKQLQPVGGAKSQTPQVESKESPNVWSASSGMRQSGAVRARFRDAKPDFVPSQGMVKVAAISEVEVKTARQYNTSSRVISPEPHAGYSNLPHPPIQAHVDSASHSSKLPRVPTCGTKEEMQDSPGSASSKPPHPPIGGARIAEFVFDGRGALHGTLARVPGDQGETTSSPGQRTSLEGRHPETFEARLVEFNSDGSNAASRSTVGQVSAGGNQKSIEGSLVQCRGSPITPPSRPDSHGDNNKEICLPQTAGAQVVEFNFDESAASSRATVGRIPVGANQKLPQGHLARDRRVDHVVVTRGHVIDSCDVNTRQVLVSPTSSKCDTRSFTEQLSGKAVRENAQVSGKLVASALRSRDNVTNQTCADLNVGRANLPLESKNPLPGRTLHGGAEVSQPEEYPSRNLPPISNQYSQSLNPRCFSHSLSYPPDLHYPPLGGRISEPHHPQPPRSSKTPGEGRATFPRAVKVRELKIAVLDSKSREGKAVTMNTYKNLGNTRLPRANNRADKPELKINPLETVKIIQSDGIGNYVRQDSSGPQNGEILFHGNGEVDRTSDAVRGDFARDSFASPRNDEILSTGIPKRDRVTVNCPADDEVSNHFKQDGFVSLQHSEMLFNGSQHDSRKVGGGYPRAQNVFKQNSPIGTQNDEMLLNGHGKVDRATSCGVEQGRSEMVPRDELLLDGSRKLDIESDSCRMANGLTSRIQSDAKADSPIREQSNTILCNRNFDVDDKQCERIRGRSPLRSPRHQKSEQLQNPDRSKTQKCKSRILSPERYSDEKAKGDHNSIRLSEQNRVGFQTAAKYKELNRLRSPERVNMDISLERRHRSPEKTDVVQRFSTPRKSISDDEIPAMSNKPDESRFRSPERSEVHEISGPSNLEKSRSSNLRIKTSANLIEKSRFDDNPEKSKMKSPEGLEDQQVTRFGCSEKYNCDALQSSDKSVDSRTSRMLSPERFYDRGINRVQSPERSVDPRINGLKNSERVGDQRISTIPNPTGLTYERALSKFHKPFDQRVEEDPVLRERVRDFNQSPSTSVKSYSKQRRNFDADRTGIQNDKNFENRNMGTTSTQLNISKSETIGRAKPVTITSMSLPERSAHAKSPVVGPIRSRGTTTYGECRVNGGVLSDNGMRRCLGTSRVFLGKCGTKYYSP